MSEKMEPERVKGSCLVGLAMVINSQKNLDWKGKTELTDPDLKVIHEGILPSAWYEKGLYERMGMAVYNLIGQGKPEGAVLFGAGVLTQTMLNVYRSPLSKDDPAKMLEKYASLYHGTLFEKAWAEFNPAEQGGIFRIEDPTGIPCPQCFLFAMKGFFAQIVKENKGENVRVECEEESVVATQPLKTLTYHIFWQKK